MAAKARFATTEASHRTAAALCAAVPRNWPRQRPQHSPKPQNSEAVYT